MCRCYGDAQDRPSKLDQDVCSVRRHDASFDSINREMMLKILSKSKVPEPLVKVIVKMYTHIEISTSVKATFPLTSGVKQGDNLAPVRHPSRHGIDE
jgi:hypothetical protein